MTMKYYYMSEAKSLKLDIPILNYETMLKEATALKDRFTGHYDTDPDNIGWKSLSLYGIGETKHESWNDYGYANAEEAAKDFIWTPAAYECPTIMNWLLTQFPSKRFGRVRLMLLEAGGQIGEHSDTTYKILENINIPLSNPNGCIWYWSEDDFLFMEPGGVYAMNISYPHKIINDSLEDRYHLIVSRHDSTDEWRKIMDKAIERDGITGEYILGPIAT